MDVLAKNVLVGAPLLLTYKCTVKVKEKAVIILVLVPLSVVTPAKHIIIVVYKWNVERHLDQVHASNTHVQKQRLAGIKKNKYNKKRRFR